MTDVFISYGRADHAIAKVLADDLEACGYDVWWDFQLYAGQDFHDAILEELMKCKACVVIWSDTSVRSSFVRDEAMRAQRAKKLITTHVPEFDLDKIPIGFGTSQSVEVTNLAAVVKGLTSLTARGLRQSTPSKAIPVVDDISTAAPFHIGRELSKALQPAFRLLKPEADQLGQAGELILSDIEESLKKLEQIDDYDAAMATVTEAIQTASENLKDWWFDELIRDPAAALAHLGTMRAAAENFIPF